MLGAVLILLALAQSYDLVLRGGRLLDPRNGIDAVMDVAVANGTIAEEGAAAFGSGRGNFAMSTASKEPDADDSAVGPEQSLQPERSAKRGATSRGGGAPRHSTRSEGSEPSGAFSRAEREALSDKPRGWGPRGIQ